MASQPAPLLVDADGHVLEPPDTWIRYIDPQYRDRAIRIDHDPNGYEVLLFDGKPLELVRGTLGSLGGVGSSPEEIEALLTPGKRSYLDGCPAGSYDPKARIRLMDREGVDMSLLYPSIGLAWEGHVSDPKLATAYARAYNRWIIDFCSESPKRLFPIAHVSLLDPEHAAEEAAWARKNGCVGVFVSPDMPGGIHFDDPRLVRFWETLQELEMPVGLHVIVRDTPSFREWLRPEADFALFNFTFLAIDVMAAFTQLISLGMFEKYPRLKCAVLEAGSNWISAWLDRMDHKYRPMASRTSLKLKPSDYFYRQCLVSADPAETMTASVIEHIGPEYFTWASDYPHLDAEFGEAKGIQERLSSLPQPDRSKVLGENVVRFYGLGS